MLNVNTHDEVPTRLSIIQPVLEHQVLFFEYGIHSESLSQSFK